MEKFGNIDAIPTMVQVMRINENDQWHKLNQPTHTIERWLYTAQHRVKTSIKRQQKHTKQTMQPIRNFFQHVVPPHIPQIIRRNNLPQNDNRDNHPNNNDPNPVHVERNSNYITRAITTFFQPSKPPILTHLYQYQRMTIFHPNVLKISSSSKNKTHKCNLS